MFMCVYVYVCLCLCVFMTYLSCDVIDQTVQTWFTAVRMLTGEEFRISITIETNDTGEQLIKCLHLDKALIPGQRPKIKERGLNSSMEAPNQLALKYRNIEELQEKKNVTDVLFLEMNV